MINNIKMMMEYLDFLDSKVMALLNTIVISIVAWMAKTMWYDFKEREKTQNGNIADLYKELSKQNEKFNSIMNLTQMNQTIIQMNQEAMLRQGDSIKDLQKELNSQYKLILEKR